MGAVDLAPVVVQRHDLGHLVVEQAVHRPAAGTAVGELAALVLLTTLRVVMGRPAASVSVG